MKLPARNETDLRKIIDAIYQLYGGRNLAVGSVTLRANQTTTTVTGDNISSDAKPQLTPTTLNAAGALATTYITSVVAGSFVITHANAVSTDRTFYWIAIGG